MLSAKLSKDSKAYIVPVCVWLPVNSMSYPSSIFINYQNVDEYDIFVFLILQTYESAYSEYRYTQARHFNLLESIQCKIFHQATNPFNDYFVFTEMFWQMQCVLLCQCRGYE